MLSQINLVDTFWFSTIFCREMGKHKLMIGAKKYLGKILTKLAFSKYST